MNEWHWQNVACTPAMFIIPSSHHPFLIISSPSHHLFSFLLFNIILPGHVSFTQLFSSYYRPLCLYAIHYLQNAELAEDIVQECFIKLWERQAEHPKAFLFTAVRNACIDHLRKRKPIDATIEPADLDGSITDEEAQERSFHEAELWTAVDALPDRCREILLLSKRDGLTYREIALRLGISEKTVEHQISKALKVLRGKANDFYYVWMII